MAERLNHLLVRRPVRILTKHAVEEVFQHAFVRWLILQHLLLVYLPINVDARIPCQISSHFFKYCRDRDHEVDSRAKVFIVHLHSGLHFGRYDTDEDLSFMFSEPFASYEAEQNQCIYTYQFDVAVSSVTNKVDIFIRRKCYEALNLGWSLCDHLGIDRLECLERLELLLWCFL